MKKTLAILLALAMVFSTLTVAFAEGSIGADAQACVTLNMLQGEGNGVTADYLAKTPTRLQAAIMVLRLKGLEAAALAYTGTDNFADADQVAWAGGKAIMGYLKTHPELGWVGDQGKFNPNGTMIAKDYYKVMLETLGYKQNTTEVIGDFTYPGVLEFAATKGLTKVATVTNFTNNDVAIATIEALKANVKGTEKTLAASLVDAKVITEANAIAAGVYTTVQTNFGVVSVVANDLKTVRVNFNKAVDEDTMTGTNVKLDVNTTTDTNADLVLAKDGKSVIIVRSTDIAIAQSDALKVTIDGLKSTDGQKIEDYTSTVTAVDKVEPSITSVVANNAKEVEVTFNENVNFGGSDTVYNAFSNVKIDDVIAVATVTPNYDTNSVVLGLASALTAGSHKIAIEDVVDYAGFVAPTKELPFAVGDDTTAPEIVSARSISVDTVEVTFNENLSAIGTYTVNDEDATPAFATGSKNKVRLTGFTNLNLGAIVQVKVAYVDQEDVVGNAVETEKTFTFKVADDTTLPTVKAEIADDNEITLTFSKAMNTTPGTITIENAAGTKTVLDVVDLTWDADYTDTVLVISNTESNLAAVNPQNVKVTIEDMKDNTIRANLLPDTTVTLAAKDTKAPTVFSYYKTAAGSTATYDTLTFFFSEPMNVDTMKNLSNYRVNAGTDTLATLGAKVKSVATDAKSITFQLDGVDAGSDSYDVSALKDANGNMMATDTVAKYAGTTVGLQAAESTDGVKVKVVFDTPDVSSVNAAALKIQKDGVDYATFTSVSAISYPTGTADYAGLSYATFTASKNLGTDMSHYQIVVLSNSLVKDVYGTKIDTAAGSTIIDKVAPTVKVATGATAGTFKITFSEAVNATDDATLNLDLVVRDEDGGLVTLDSTATAGSKGYIEYFKGTTAATAADFDNIIVYGDAGQKYTVQVIGRTIVDLATTPVPVTDLSATTVTVKQ